MISFWWAIGALFAGATLGFFIAGLCCAAAQNEDDEEEWRD